MPKDQKQKQKARMKKRRKDKARRAKTSKQFSVDNLIKHAREFPIMDCYINGDWQQGDGLVRIAISRELPEERLAFGSFLVDMLCLGVKDAMYFWDISRAEYESSFLPQLYMSDEAEECPVDLAHQIVYQAVDYAGQFGFKPHKDFLKAQYLLDPRGTHPEEHKLEFGKDGKPFFVAGPYDNVPVILKKLEKHAGEGNYFFNAPFDELLEDYDPEDDE